MADWTDATGRLGPGAEYYAGRGWKVFPCWGIVGGRCECGSAHASPKDNGKHPRGDLVPEGMKHATSDAEQVRDWWGRAPESNIAVSCGASGFIVVDIDPRNGGLEAWPKIVDMVEKEGGQIPATVEAITGEYTIRGGTARGRHLFFRVEEGEKLQAAVKGCRGVDVKHNGYVLVNPSRHASGLLYEWAPGRAPWETEMAAAPEELLGLLRRRPRRAGGGSGGGEGLGLGVLEWDGEKVDVDALVADGIREGERAVTLYRVACAIANKFPVDTEMGRAAVRQLMKGINQKHVVPPLDWDEELAAQVDRAIEFVRENPAGVTETLAPGLMEWAQSQGPVETEKPREVPRVVRPVAAASPVTAAGDTMPVVEDETLPPDIDEWGDNTLPDGTAVRRTLTDRGNARRLVDYYGNTVRYTPGMGWFIWTGDHWRRDPDGDEVLEKTQIVSRLIHREVLGMDIGSEEAKRVMEYSIESKSTAKLKNAREQWKVNTSVTRAPVEFWDSNTTLLGVKNGVIDLKTGELLAADPRMGISKRTDVAYAPGQRNMRWTQFLDFATGGDVELQDWLQRAAGYTLTGLRRFDVLFLVYGQPGSGKSTFLEAIQTALGTSYAMSMPSNVLVDEQSGGMGGSTDYYMAELIGRRMCVFSEWPAGKRTKEDTVKRLTGDLSVTARPIRESPITFTSQAKLWIGTNARPRVEEEAMWRRIRAIPFTHVPEKPDPELKEYLTGPEGGLPAVLSWAVDGAVKLLNSSNRDALGWCTAVAEASAEYRKSEDRIGLFLEEETMENPGGSVEIGVLHSVARGWFEDRGERPMTAMSFGKALDERGMDIRGHGRRAILQGRVLRPRSVGSESGSSDWDSLTSRFRS